MRLVNTTATVGWLTYVSFWGDQRCRGYFLAKIALDTGIVDTRGRIRLLAPRNSAIYQYNGATIEIVDIGPVMTLRDIRTNATRAILSVPGDPLPLHNSIHPVWIDRWERFLVLGHRHLREGGAFSYGHAYIYIALLFDPQRMRVTDVSKPFALTKHGIAPPQKTRGIQYAMGAFVRNNTLQMSVGLDDCWSTLLPIRLESLCCSTTTAARSRTLF